MITDHKSKMTFKDEEHEASKEESCIRPASEIQNRIHKKLMEETSIKIRENKRPRIRRICRAIVKSLIKSIGTEQKLYLDDPKIEDKKVRYFIVHNAMDDLEFNALDRISARNQMLLVNVGLQLKNKSSFMRKQGATGWPMEAIEMNADWIINDTKHMQNAITRLEALLTVRSVVPIFKWDAEINEMKSHMSEKVMEELENLFAWWDKWDGS